MASIGILGEINSGKTTCFRMFSKLLEEKGDRVLKHLPGGGITDDENKINTQTVDFLRFTYKGFLHVLYGTGGHKNAKTTYYRDWVLRNADRFLCMIDLTAPLEGQLQFFKIANIPVGNVVIIFNKFDLAADNFEKYKEQTLSFFRQELDIQVPEFFPTVALDKDGYDEYNQNCFNAVVSLCAFDKGYGITF